MSEHNESPNGTNKAPINIPSLEEVERLRANRSKQLPSFFKSKRPLEESSSASESPTSVTTSNVTMPPPPSSSNQASTTVNRHVSSPALDRPVITASPQSTSSTTPSSHTTLPAGFRRASGSTILVNPKQQKNPILKHIYNVPWEPSDAIKVDYVVGQTTGVIYLSLKYHRLYPTYIYDRLNSVKNLYVTRILLVNVDIESFHDAIREVNRIAILSDFTLMLAWSFEEAGRYLETYKAFENKGPDLIRERVDDEYLPKMTDCLTQIKSVNKTDVLTLLSTFGSLKQISGAKADQLAMCPGFGDQKVKRLMQAWKQPFLANKKQKK